MFIILVIAKVLYFTSAIKPRGYSSLSRVLIYHLTSPDKVMIEKRVYLI